MGIIIILYLWLIAIAGMILIYNFISRNMFKPIKHELESTYLPLYSEYRRLRFLLNIVCILVMSFAFMVWINT